MYTIVCRGRCIFMISKQNGQLGEVAFSEHDQGIGKRGRGSHGAKTFRRGRVLAFYQQLVIKRDTLKKQLACPEYQTIQQVIAGELKATEDIINDFKAAFELQEVSNEISDLNKHDKSNQ